MSAALQRLRLCNQPTSINQRHQTLQHASSPFEEVANQQQKQQQEATSNIQKLWLLDSHMGCFRQLQTTTQTWSNWPGTFMSQ